MIYLGVRSELESWLWLPSEGCLSRGGYNVCLVAGVKLKEDSVFCVIK